MASSMPNPHWRDTVYDLHANPDGLGLKVAVSIGKGQDSNY